MDAKCSRGHRLHVMIKGLCRGGHCAEGTQAASSLTEGNFLQMKKMLMTSFETLGACEGPHAWNEHLPYGVFGN